MFMKVRKSTKHSDRKLKRVRYLRWIKEIPARVVADGKFDPSYVYHVEAGRFVSKDLMVEKAIAKSLGIPWEKI